MLNQTVCFCERTAYEERVAKDKRLDAFFVRQLAAYEAWKKEATVLNQLTDMRKRFAG